MAKPHKYDKSRIEIDTALSQEKLAEVIGGVIDVHKPLHLEGEEDGVILATVKSFVGLVLISFAIAMTSEEGRTRAVSEMLDYSMSQETLFYLIPVSPRTINGYGDYRRFMKALKSVVEEADPTAKCVIIEQESVG